MGSLPPCLPAVIALIFPAAHCCKLLWILVEMIIEIEFFDMPVVQCAVEEERRRVRSFSLLYGDNVNVPSIPYTLIPEHVK